MTPKELALHLDSDPKTVRKFLRSISDDRAGKGGRWVIDENDLDAIEKLWESFSQRRTTTLRINLND